MLNKAITERTDGRVTLKVFYDPDPLSPRKEWDNLGTIVYTSNRYVLGDEKVTASDIDAITDDPENIWLPVYAYIHGSVALRTGPFGCRWDSGQSGVIYCTKADARRWFPSTPEESLQGMVEACFRIEVGSYSDYCQGQVYGICCYVDGEEVRSVWGFYGDPEELLDTEWDDFVDPEWLQPKVDYQI